MNVHIQLLIGSPLPRTCLTLHPSPLLTPHACNQVLAAGGEAAVAAVQAELALTERALHRNPKSYATWHHRRYLVAQGMCSLEHELALVGGVLRGERGACVGKGLYRQ